MKSVSGHLNSRDLTKQEKTGAMSSFTSSSKTIKRSSSRRLRKKLETADSSSLFVRMCYVCGQPSNTHARPGRLWQRRSSGSEATRVTVPFSWKVEGGIPDLRVKNFQQKKTDRPPVKTWAMLVEAETFFCLALQNFDITSGKSLAVVWSMVGTRKTGLT